MSVITVEARWDSGRTEENEEGETVKIYDKAAIPFDFGENIEEAVALFGTEPVYATYLAQGKVQVQGAIRAQGEAGVPVEEIASRLSALKIGVRMGRVQVDPIAALKAQYALADEAGQAALLAQIMGEEG